MKLSIQPMGGRIRFATHPGCVCSGPTTLKPRFGRLRSKGVPVHALGIEAHLIAARDPFSAAKLSRFLQDVSSIGLKILVTELDVSDRYLPATLPLRDQMVADEYARFLAPVLDNKNVAAVLTWGLSDRYSWLKKFAPRADGQPVRPLPLDADLKPKLAWEAVARSLDHAPARNNHLSPS